MSFKMEKGMISGRTIQGRLFESFEKHSDNIAIECGGVGLTYKELDEYSDKIANWLTAQGIKKETFIAIMADDRIALVTMILGVIKAGCVFVPMDSRYPSQRTEAMLRTSEVPYVIVGESNRERLKEIRRELSHRLDIILMNETFYLPGSSLQPGIEEDKYKLSEAEKTRYTRQLLMDGWGIAGQERLKASTVFVAGAGGSGSPLIQQLALCGFGTIIICDFDTVELSNLNRQSLHDETRIGMNKALSAKLTVERMNPNINVIAKSDKITRENVFELVGDAEIIFDNVDSLEAKSCLSECAVARGIPHTISSMIHMNAYACIFHTPHTPCFHCLYDRGKIEDITKAKEMTAHYKVIPNSVASPALYMSTGFVVNEAVKILLGMGVPAYNKYFHFNQYGSPEVVKTNGYNQITYPFSEHFRELSRTQGFDWDTGWHGSYIEEIVISPDPNCPNCSKPKVFQGVQGDSFSKMPPWPPEAKREISCLPDDKINIYFTSGTSGQPKAVLGRNESMTHFIAWEIREFGIDSDARVSQLTSQCHDPFLRDIFVPLCAGGTICVPGSRETILDSERIKAWLEESRVNIVHCTPSLFKIINSEGLNGGSYSHLKYVLLAGEKVMPRELESWYDAMGDRVRLVNIYGPTETTLAKLFYLVKPEDVKRDTMPIGKAIPGSKVIILDKEMNVCGRDEVGEIYIRTPFRSYGYYRDPELTAQRFIQNPFSDVEGDIIYKTGDLGKVNGEGDVEFVGREDRQIKIRGFRVELDEVEKRIREYEGISESVVVDRRSATGNYYLCAYFSGRVTSEELREYLNCELPDYMVPSFFIKMESFPLNVNGKINYGALPPPDEVERSGYIAPRTEVEKAIAGIWTEILGIEKIGLTDDFLGMGGNSLNAMNLTTRVYKRFNVNLPLSEIFKNPSVEDLASMIEGTGKSIYETIGRVEEREYYPLSSSQMRMFLLREFAGEMDISYNQTKPLHIKGRLDRERLENAFRRLIDRHDSLRTGFELLEDRPMQRIRKEVAFSICELDAKSSMEQTIRNFIQPFNLSRAPLLRVGLIKAAKDEHVLVFDIHHIISDGMTTGIFIEEFMKLYAGEELPELGLQYKDYAVWQQDMLQSDRLKKQEDYWKDVFKEIPPALNLPIDFPRPTVQRFEGAHWTFEIDSSLVVDLEALGGVYGTTLYMVMLVAYTVLLYRYTGQEDIVVGSPIAGRSHVEIQNIPGVFINMLAMRNFPASYKTIENILTEVKETAFNAYENQGYPFEELVGKLDLQRDMERSPLFETLFIMQNIKMKPIVLEGLEIAPYPFDMPTSKFDISINVLETPEGYLFSVEYCTQLFREETIRRLSSHFITILKAMVSDISLPLSRIDMLSQGERERLLIELNNTAGNYPRNKRIETLFMEQVRRTPDVTAIVGPNKIYCTYTELDRRSNELAYLLSEKGLQPGDIAALTVERTLEMPAAIIAVLKVGAAYLPIDTGAPAERANFILADSHTKIRVDSEMLTEGVIEAGYTKDTLETDPGDPAYIIYTSGSTGRPKGVVVSHRNVSNFFEGIVQGIDFSPGKAILAVTTISFDIFTLEVLLPLVRGLRTVVANEAQGRDAYRLVRLMEEQGIDMLQVTPSRLKSLLHESTSRNSFKGLSELIVGGEALPVDLYEILKKVYKGQFYNVYGPTETTVWSTLKNLTGRGKTLTIGKPILNTKILILDKDGNLLPQGAVGELCISGEGVSIGYLNRPELSAERFKEPYWSNGSNKFYRTGDLARWTMDGEIQFLGRIDHQVKIRGFRIEVGEIENRLMAHPAIKEAVVTAPTIEGETALCAYIVLNGPESPDIGEIREFLSVMLPDYMLPSYFEAIREIPLTASGKIDRNALPVPQIGTHDDYEAPANGIEKSLIEIWSDILPVKSQEVIGVSDNFFHLGGHSLKATLLLSRIHEIFNVRVPMTTLFKTPTIRGLSKYIQTAKQEVYVPIDFAEKKEYYPLSFNQKRLWIIQQLEEKKISYNMPMRIEYDHALDEQAIKKSLSRLIKRHESLRTGFKTINGIVYQIIEPDVEVPFKIVDISSRDPKEKERIFKETARTPFDLSKAPLFRATAVKYADTQFELVFNMHHIISDGWSIGLLENEFNRLYQDFRNHRETSFPPLRYQYKDFSEWHNYQLRNPQLMEASRVFWIEKLSGGFPRLQLPVDFNAGRDKNSGAAYRCFADIDIQERLNALARKCGTTLSTVMFSIFNILLAHISNQEDILCSLISAGREHISLRDIVGYFTNSIILKTHVDMEDDFEDFVRKIHADVISTLQHQRYPLESVLDEQEMNFPDISVSFNMNNMPGIVSSIHSLESQHIEKDQGVKFDLALLVTEHIGGIELFWNYRKSLFEPRTIESIANVYLEFLAELSEDIM